MSKKGKSNVIGETALTKVKKDPGFFREVWQQVRLVFRLLRDPEVPFYLKLLPFVAVVYLLWPLDFLADFAPVAGQLDDLTILLVGSKVFIELAPPHIVARHLDEIRLQDGYDSFSDDTTDEDELKETIIIQPDKEDE